MKKTILTSILAGAMALGGCAQYNLNKRLETADVIGCSDTLKKEFGICFPEYGTFKDSGYTLSTTISHKMKNSQHYGEKPHELSNRVYVLAAAAKASGKSNLEILKQADLNGDKDIDDEEYCDFLKRVHSFDQTINGGGGIKGHIFVTKNGKKIPMYTSRHGQIFEW